ncbi:hypothetical protein [Natronolimnohabitans innermongolicus]|uniref:DUF8053 domain-containing protein n=1 Tax=Natronolimnohabitans innermongolicus JCM 12255 TaxID=1227499 RepID=L9X4I6_9EURY|nr:hypothetical protein [Natronolimnohabitans innermongolicus]ELY56615.1 hypothetical protein C493_09585 [Natronolimnohabitans innermongolicus JCM 12255]
MALNKLRQLDSDSVGITLPKDDMRVEGLIDENGELAGDHHIHIRHVGEGEWRLKLINSIDT